MTSASQIAGYEGVTFRPGRGPHCPGSGTKTVTNRPLVDDALHQLPGQPVRSHHIVGNLGNGALAYQPLLAPKSLVLWFGEASGKPISLDFFCFFPGREGMTLRHFVYNQLDGADDGRSTT